MENDKETINNLYARIRDFQFEECESKEMKQLTEEVKEGFKIILKGIKYSVKNIDSEK